MEYRHSSLWKSWGNFNAMGTKHLNRLSQIEVLLLMQQLFFLSVSTYTTKLNIKQETDGYFIIRI